MDSSIAPLAAYGFQPFDDEALLVGPPSHAGTPFPQIIERELGNVNADVAAAQAALGDLAAGKPVELHNVMISLERARLSVQAFVQIRNRLVESYQDLMRMQM